MFLSVTEKRRRTYSPADRDGNRRSFDDGRCDAIQQGSLRLGSAMASHHDPIDVVFVAVLEDDADGEIALSVCVISIPPL